MTEPTVPEPSMEEILASIRRIISEDLAAVDSAGVAGEDEGAEAKGEPAGAAPQAGDEDVLILRERAPPQAEPAAVQEPLAESPAPGETRAQPAEEVAVATAEPAAPAASFMVPAQAAPRQGLVAPEVAKSAAASLERLYFVVENTPPPPQVAVSAAGPTLEDLTRELIRPIVKAWLDENLDALVKARVDEEIERIARNRVR